MADFVSIGFRAVHRSKRDGLVWAGSKIVRDHAEAERVVAQWQAGYPQHEEDPLCFEVQEVFARPLGVNACQCAARLAGRVDGDAHFEGCPHFVPPNTDLRRALGDIISQTVAAERMGYADPQDWQEKFQRVRQIARDALGVNLPDGAQQ